MNELLEEVEVLLENLARLLEVGFDSGQEAFNFFRMTGQGKTGIDFIRTVEQVIRTTPMILENALRIYEQSEDLLEHLGNILENRQFIRTNKIILEHIKVY